MAAINPRITITLKPEVHAVLRRLSALTGDSQSFIVGDLLESSLQVFERMAKVLEAAKAAQAGMSSDIASGLAQAQARIETQMGLMLDDIEQAQRPILEMAESIKRRKTKGAAAKGAAPAAPGAGAVGASVAVSTPISNRGVRSAKTRPIPPEGVRVSPRPASAARAKKTGAA